MSYNLPYDPLVIFAIVLGIFLIWITVLSIFLWRTVSHYNNLTKGSNNKNLRLILDSLLKQMATAKTDIENLKERYDRIEKDSTKHIQKIGLLRFNPFKDTGGDQSFILSLVDKNDTGVIISGLYSRSGTRWYAKRIKEGKALEHELSEEEKKAIKEATGN